MPERPSARDLFDQRVLPLFERNRGDWLTMAREAAVRLARIRSAGITINDVRAACPPPDDVDPRVMGGVFTRKQWRKVGYVNSERRECHGRPLAVFQLREGVSA